MEALVTAFVAAFLGEWGDKTQLVVAMLATTRKARPGSHRPASSPRWRAMSSPPSRASTSP